MALALAVTSIRSRVVSTGPYCDRGAVPHVGRGRGLDVVYVLNGGTGPLNYYLHDMGITGPNWLGSSTWALPGLVVIDVWATIGFTFIIFLVGLQSLPADLNESASIDGAGAMARFRHITLPMLSPATLVASVTAFIGAFEIFTWPLIDTDGGPGTATQTICSTYIARPSRTTGSATAQSCRL